MNRIINNKDIYNEYYNGGTTNTNISNILFIIVRITIIEALQGARHLPALPPWLFPTIQQGKLSSLCYREGTLTWQSFCDLLKVPRIVTKMYFALRATYVSKLTFSCKVPCHWAPSTGYTRLSLHVLMKGSAQSGPLSSRTEKRQGRLSPPWLQTTPAINAAELPPSSLSAEFSRNYCTYEYLIMILSPTSVLTTSSVSLTTRNPMHLH